MSDTNAPREGWLEQRLGLRSIMARLLQGEVSPKWAWLRTTGMVCLVLVLVEFVTGSVLGVYFTPATNAAYKDVLALEQNPMGRFLRGVHHWASAALILLSLFTVVRMFFGAEYKGRRDVVWIAAIIFMQLVLLFQVTGHALPWDTNGAASANVEAGIANNVWVVGPMVKRFLLGGASLGAVTLTRWYGFHVFLLPLALILLVGLPLLAYRLRAGSAEEQTEEPVDTPDGRREPYYPFHMAREMAVSLVVVLVIAGLALATRTPLEKEANAGNLAGYKAMSEWYVLPMHAATLIPPFNQALFEPLATLVAPGLLMGLLLVLPWLDRNPHRRAARRRFATACGTLTLVGIFGLYGYALIVERPSGAEVEKLAVGAPGAKPVVVDTALASAGKGLYVKQSCNACHAIAGAGGKSGPDLTRAGLLHSDRQWQIDHLKNPPSKVPGSTMPPYAQLKEDELKALAEYMLSLR